MKPNPKTLQKIRLRNCDKHQHCSECYYNYSDPDGIFNDRCFLGALIDWSLKREREEDDE